MKMSDAKEMIGEQWQLISIAPIPYIAGLVALGFCMFLAFQWRYQGILDGKDTQIGTLERSLKAVTEERDSLRGKNLGSVTLPPQTNPPQNPDALYQFNEAVATVSGGRIDRSNGKVEFSLLSGGPNFNINQYFEYRSYYFAGCKYAISSKAANFGVVSSTFYREVTCDLIGRNQ